jgi:hypothetical protein
VRVTEGVNVTVGIVEVYPDNIKSIPIEGQKTVEDGVGVGVLVTVGVGVEVGVTGGT